MDDAPGKGLQVSGLRKSYRNRPVIRDVGLKLDRGEVVQPAGPERLGQDDLFLLRGRADAPDSGHVVIDGVDATALPMYRRAQMSIGYLPQEMSIFRTLTVEQNIEAVLELVCRDAHHRHDRLEEYWATSRSGICAARRPWRCRGRTPPGRDRALPRRTRPICCWTNPSPASTPIAVGEIRGLVHDLKSRGIGVLITDHNVRRKPLRSLTAPISCMTVMC